MDSPRHVSIFFAIDLAARKFQITYRSLLREAVDNRSGLEEQSWAFDSTTKIHICANKNGASDLPCTVSQLDLFYSYLDDPVFSMGYVSGVARIISTLPKYLISESSSACGFLSTHWWLTYRYHKLFKLWILWYISSRVHLFEWKSSIGDSASSPTTGTAPSWDSSVIFIYFEGSLILYSLRKNLSKSLLQDSSSHFLSQHFCPVFHRTLLLLRSLLGFESLPSREHQPQYFRCIKLMY